MTMRKHVLRDAIETAVVRIVDDGHLPAVAGPDVADELYDTIQRAINGPTRRSRTVECPACGFWKTAEGADPGDPCRSTDCDSTAVEVRWVEASAYDALAAAPETDGEAESLREYIGKRQDQFIKLDRSDVSPIIGARLDAYEDVLCWLDRRLAARPKADGRWRVVWRHDAQTAENADDFAEELTDDRFSWPEVLMHGNRIVRVFNPEPEDASLSRDYSPVVDLLNQSRVPGPAEEAAPHAQ